MVVVIVVIVVVVVVVVVVVRKPHAPLEINISRGTRFYKQDAHGELRPPVLSREEISMIQILFPHSPHRRILSKAVRPKKMYTMPLPLSSAHFHWQTKWSEVVATSDLILAVL